MRTRSARRPAALLRFLLTLLLASLAPTACSTDTPANALRVGALFPLEGSQAPLAREEYEGVRIAAQLVNQDGEVKVSGEATAALPSRG